MSETTETASPAAPRDGSSQARQAARLVKAGRERGFVGLLNRGVSIAEIAAREGVTEKRMRALVATFSPAACRSHPSTFSPSR